MPSITIGRAAARALGTLAVLAAAPVAAQSLPGDLVVAGIGFTIVDNRATTSRLDLVGTGATLPALGDNLTLRLSGLRKPGGGSIADWFATLTFVPADLGPTVTAFVFGVPAAGEARVLGDAPVTLAFNSGFVGRFTGAPVGPGDVQATEGSGTNGCLAAAAPRPSALSHAFNGRAIAGSWFLTIGDCLSDGGGSVASWELAFVTRTSTVPEPATTLLLAAGLAGTALVPRVRRRARRATTG